MGSPITLLLTANSLEMGHGLTAMDSGTFQAQAQHQLNQRPLTVIPTLTRVLYRCR